ncbi:hypothetical protein TVAG_335110 [Trichomonas vaginalis G3]|uniref:HECT-type E3 ubiquitin transferase n=1 Tax=Trichomonas vaginalis (strain ATCC PRA-98 / G3) TaxID=412133 RepID=A2FK98_TRIV3|nr:ubiquitin protein ligase protein [Trichomonas vaginalis G3]EAX94675.1 hypothetical protein TVAG_335110 [Trichomonas vaginalis G3]KAI5510193.1 ubiquitin protein ligase protein [Trichomonas vaginalis G3]|eukprot:XP_001307605.1 hypothetical protein [Trichomonas vaginalis G3]
MNGSIVSLIKEIPFASESLSANFSKAALSRGEIDFDMQEYLYKYSSQQENQLLSFTHIYDKLLRKIRSQFDQNTKNYTRFIINRVPCEDQVYSQMLSTENFDEIPDSELYYYITQSENKIDPLNYSKLLERVLKTAYPRTKLAAIQFFMKIRYNTAHAQFELPEINHNKIELVESCSMNNWATNETFLQYLAKSSTHCLQISIIENSINVIYILYKNNQGFYIFNINKQTILHDGNTIPISSILNFPIINLSVVNGKLTFICLNGLRSCAIQLDDDAVPSTKITKEPNDLCKLFDSPEKAICNIDGSKVYFNNQSKIVGFDLVSFTKINPPDYYFKSRINYIGDEYLSITATDKIIFFDKYRHSYLSRYTPIIRPSFPSSSLIAATIIGIDMLDELTMTFEHLIKGIFLPNDLVSNQDQNIEEGMQFYEDLHKSDIDPAFTFIMDTMLMRFFALNLRQKVSLNEKISDLISRFISRCFSKINTTVPHLNTIDMLVRTTNSGVYWPSLLLNIQSHFTDIFSLPQSLFFDMTSEYEKLNDDDLLNVITIRMNDIYYLTKTRKSSEKKNDAKTTKSIYDREFLSFFKSVFSLIQTRKLSVSRILLKKVLEILSVIPLRRNLAELSLNFLVNELNLNKLMTDDVFPDVCQWFADDRKPELYTIKLNTTVFSSENNYNDINLELETPFDELMITNEKNKPDNVFFNFEEFKNPQILNGFELNLSIISAQKNNQFLINGTETKSTSLEFLKYCIPDSIFSLISLVVNKCLKKLEKVIEISEFERQNQSLLNLLFRKNKEDDFIYEMRGKMKFFVKEVDTKEKEKLLNSHQINLVLATENKFTKKLFSKEDKRLATASRMINNNNDYFKSILQILVSIFYSCDYLKEFNELLEKEKIDPLKMPEWFEAINTKFQSLFTNIRKSIQDEANGRQENDGVLSQISYKYKFLMESQLDSRNREERMEDIFAIYSLDFKKSDLMNVEEANRKRKELKNEISQYVKKFMSKFTNKNLSAAIYRSFIQLFDLEHHRDLVDTFDSKMVALNDTAYTLHMIPFTSKLENVAEQFLNARSDFIRNVTLIIYAIFGRTNYVMRNVTLLMEGNENEYYSNIYDTATTSQGYNFLMPKIINSLRQKKDAKFFLQKVTPELDQNTISAFILLGAEIFDSDITRYVLVGDNCVSVNNSKLTDAQKKSNPSCFMISPPNFEVDQKLTKSLVEIIQKMDFNIKDITTAIKNCIVMSFFSKVMKNVKNPQEFALNFPQISRVSKEINSTKIPAYSSNVFCHKIRQLMMFSEIKESKKDTLICLSQNTSANRIIKGSVYTSSFFVYTKVVGPSFAVKFNFDKFTNQLKYLGFIDEDWNCCFLSFLDKRIYMDKKSYPFNDNMTKLTLTGVDNFVQFNDMKIDFGTDKNKWIFLITVCDNSKIKYTVEKAVINPKVTTEKPQEHQFDVKKIFPDICIGMSVKLEGFYDAFVRDFHSNYFIVDAIDEEIDAYQSAIPCRYNQIEQKQTDFESIINIASKTYEICDINQNKEKLLNIIRQYTFSIMKTFMNHFDPSNFIIFTIESLAKLTDDAPQKQIDEIKYQIESDAKRKQILDLIVQKLKEFDSSPQSKKTKDFDALNNDPSSSYQYAFFQGWNHGLLMQKTFINGCHFLFDFEKICSAFAAKILVSFKNDVPNNVDDAKLYLKYFDLPIDYKISASIDFAIYLNQIVTFVFQNDPQFILQKSDHSKLINSSAKLLCKELFTFISTNQGDKMTLLPLFSNVTTKMERHRFTIANCSNLLEVIDQKGVISILNPNTQKAVKFFRYIPEQDPKKCLTQWKEWNNKDFRQCLTSVVETIQSLKTVNVNYPNLVVYYCHLAYCETNGIPEDYYDMKGPRERIYNQLQYLTSLRGFDAFQGHIDAGKFIVMTIPIKETYARTFSYNNAKVIIDTWAEHSKRFKTTILKEEGYSRMRFYMAIYLGETGIDASGLFKDSLSQMVDELMDVNFRMFVPPQPSLKNVNYGLVPSSSLSEKRSFAIGALIACEVATNNTAKWTLPMFIWNYLASDEKAVLEEFVDCDDKIYFNGLKSVLAHIKKGFNDVIAPEKIAHITGNYLKMLAIGSQEKMTLDKFKRFVEPNGNITNVLFDAVAAFTHEEFMQLIKFITGQNTIPPDGIVIKVRSSPPRPNQRTEQQYAYPVAHLCFNTLDLMPYRTPSVLRERLLFAIQNSSEIND